MVVLLTMRPSMPSFRATAAISDLSVSLMSGATFTCRCTISIDVRPHNNASRPSLDTTEIMELSGEQEMSSPFAGLFVYAGQVSAWQRVIVQGCSTYQQWWWPGSAPGHAIARGLHFLHQLLQLLPALQRPQPCTRPKGPPLSDMLSRWHV